MRAESVECPLRCVSIEVGSAQARQGAGRPALRQRFVFKPGRVRASTISTPHALAPGASKSPLAVKTSRQGQRLVQRLPPRLRVPLILHRHHQRTRQQSAGRRLNAHRQVAHVSSPNHPQLLLRHTLGAVQRRQFRDVRLQVVNLRLQSGSFRLKALHLLARVRKVAGLHNLEKRDNRRRCKGDGYRATGPPGGCGLRLWRRRTKSVERCHGNASEPQREA